MPLSSFEKLQGWGDKANPVEISATKNLDWKIGCLHTYSIMVSMIGSRLNHRELTCHFTSVETDLVRDLTAVLI